MAKILVVDDSETSRKQIKTDLQPQGHEILQASDGAEGIEILSKVKDIQLVLCDVHMPKMDGLTMCEMAHHIQGYEDLIIFMLTTESNSALKIKGRELGVKAWVMKPYIASKLLAVIDLFIHKKALPI